MDFACFEDKKMLQTGKIIFNYLQPYETWKEFVADVKKLKSRFLMFLKIMLCVFVYYFLFLNSFVCFLNNVSNLTNIRVPHVGGGWGMESKDPHC